MQGSNLKTDFFPLCKIFLLQMKCVVTTIQKKSPLITAKQQFYDRAAMVGQLCEGSYTRAAMLGQLLIFRRYLLYRGSSHFMISQLMILASSWFFSGINFMNSSQIHDFETKNSKKKFFRNFFEKISEIFSLLLQ